MIGYEEMGGNGEVVEVVGIDERREVLCVFIVV